MTRLRFALDQRFLWIASFALLSAWQTPARAGEPLPEVVEFNRDIRPILSDRCFQCHGPDANQREAELRLDHKEGAFAMRDGRAVLVPGRPEESELYRRISSADQDMRMPPADEGKPLSQREQALFRRWIEQGAHWQKHWSLLAPRRPEVPSVRQKTWPRNAIDAFLLARLEREGLTPSPPADKEMLIRRVTLDLTGLPPTPAQVDAFLADDSPGAYERVVDRLLASPRYGERKAILWLDAARYADTSGYQTDGVREMWRWRDWVIGAYNRNLPFDRFTSEQLAGDLLPDPTLEQLIATGFNRNHRMNSEGGIVPEEFLVEYAVDRVDTTFTVWLGLTIGCARCHEHKYDPIPQEDFYRVLAYFNNVPERGRVIKYGNEAPFIKAPTPPMQARLEALDRHVAEAGQAFAALKDRLAAEQRKWEQRVAAGKQDVSNPSWMPEDGLAYHFPLDESLAPKRSKHSKGKTETEKAAKDKPAASEKQSEASVELAAGRFGKAALFDGKHEVELGAVKQLTGADRFSISCWVYLEERQTAPLVSIMNDDDSRDKGLALRVRGGRVVFNFGQRWLDDAIRIETKAKLEPQRWHHIALTYGGSQRAAGTKLYIDGGEQETRVLLDFFTGTVGVSKPLRLGSQGGKERLRGRIDELRIYHRELPAREVLMLSSARPLPDIVRTKPSERTAAESTRLAAYYLHRHAPQEVRAAAERLASLREKRQALWDDIPTTMVMQERSEVQPTFLLERGQYDKRGKPVTRGVPQCLPPLPEGAANNRLGFAKWLFLPGHPLTARVAVNRMWQMHFGTGLVATPEDFGSQGDWPTHPKLLDWLATELVRTGWDVKRMHRLVVTSAAYRQWSGITPKAKQADPDNRLLSRFPRLRLTAEVVRDQALAAAGLLDTRIGGPSVKPYQPAGLWEEIASDRYQQDHGRKLYRRSLYTFWKRTVPPPSMTTFDATSREACTVQRSRTNTPLQALALLNDVTYVEAARKLAERVLREAGTSPESRLTRAFRWVTGRHPASAELAVLKRHVQRTHKRFENDPKAAEALLSVGEAPRDESLPVAAVAAYASAANLILNLDEVVMRE